LHASQKSQPQLFSSFRGQQKLQENFSFYQIRTFLSPVDLHNAERGRKGLKNVVGVEGGSAPGLSVSFRARSTIGSN